MAVSQETLAILGVGIALAGIILAGNGGLGDRIDGLDARIDRLESRIDRLDVRLAAVEREIARIIGLLEGRKVNGLSLPSPGGPAESDDNDEGLGPLPPPPSLPG